MDCCGGKQTTWEGGVKAWNSFVAERSRMDIAFRSFTYDIFATVLPLAGVALPAVGSLMERI